MAQATLQEMAREVQLYSGMLTPILMAKRWVRDRYRKVCEKVLWSFKLGRNAFGTADIYSTGTVTLTLNSATVAGSGTTWTSAMVGRQLKVNGYVFTIVTVPGTTSMTIDQVWLANTTASNTYSIVSAYITPTPTDFHAFYSVVDPTRAWKLQLAFNSKDLDRIDARRSSAGVPRLLANGVYNASNIPTYELWPNPNSSNMYIYTYERRVPDLNDSDTPPAIIRSDTIVKGALADLARWPGTAEAKNPMFDPYFTQWKIREAEFDAEIEKAIVEDQSIMMQDLALGHSLNFAPIDANFIQSHAM